MCLVLLNIRNFVVLCIKLHGNQNLMDIIIILFIKKRIDRYYVIKTDLKKKLRKKTNFSLYKLYKRFLGFSFQVRFFWTPWLSRGVVRRRSWLV